MYAILQQSIAVQRITMSKLLDKQFAVLPTILDILPHHISSRIGVEDGECGRATKWWA